MREIVRKKNKECALTVRVYGIMIVVGNFAGLLKNLEILR